MRKAGLLLLASAALISECAFAADVAFFDAVKAGNVDAVRGMLGNGQPIMARNDQQDTGLHVAAEAGTLPMVQLLLDSGSQIDEPGRESRTPLLAGVSGGNLDAVKFLLERGADATKRDRNGVSPALVASRAGSVPLLTFLADKGADLNVKDRDGDFPLLAAASRGHEDAVTFLLQRKARPNEVDSHGVTPLIIAAGAAGGPARVGLPGSAGAEERPHMGSLRIVRELVDAGANVNAVSRDAGGATPLYAALFAGNRVISTFLLDHGADANLHRRDGSTDFSVVRTACDLRRMTAYQDKFRDLRCDSLLEPGSYALCGSGGDAGAALATVEIPEANTNLIKMPSLRYSCPGTGGRSCVIESHGSPDTIEEGEEGHQDWRRSIRFTRQRGGGPNSSFVWIPEACGAGCGRPELVLKHMAPAKLANKKKSSVLLLLQPRACPAKGKCKWLDPKPVRAKQRIAALPGPRGYYCVRVEDSEDSARFGWLPAAAITLKK